MITDLKIFIRQTVYTPKLTDEKLVKAHDIQECFKQNQLQEQQNIQDVNNNHTESIISENSEHSSRSTLSDDEHIIPWRAQLRKTNSKMNLLE